jgi:hypothetical protein
MVSDRTAVAGLKVDANHELCHYADDATAVAGLKPKMCESIALLSDAPYLTVATINSATLT